MKIRILLLTLLSLLIFSLGCSRIEIDQTGLVRVSNGVYAFIAAGPSAAEGLGTNSGFVVGKEAVLVIDSRYTPELATELLEAIRTVTDLPVKYVVNTHYHPDHIWGNSVFSDMGAVIISRPETREDIEKYTPIYLDYYREQKPDKYEQLRGVRMTLPDSMMADRMLIDLGGVKAELLFFGAAHTAGDIIVRVQSEKTVFTGGITGNRYHVNMGDQGVDFENWIRILGKLEKMAPKWVVSGQGKVCGKELFGMQRKYLQDIIEIGKSSIRKGEPLSEAVRDKTIPGTEGFFQGNMLPFNIQAVYKAFVVETVDPDFSLDLPDDFFAREGSGDASRGRIQWIMQSKDGYSELEISWQPTNRLEIIVQDIHDSIARHLGTNTDKHMEISGSKKIPVGEEEAVAAFGSWGYKIGSTVAGGGIWTWAMIIYDSELYFFQMSTNTESDHEKEFVNIEILEKAVSTFHFIR